MENPAFLRKKFELHKSDEVASAANRINTKRDLQKKKELFDIYDDFHEEIITKQEFDSKKDTIIQETKNIPQNPEQQIQNYLDRFSEILNRKNPEQRQQGIEALKKVLHKQFIIPEENMDYEYFVQQEQKIAEQEGRPFDREDINGQALDNFKMIKRESVVNAQKQSLNQWIDYLSSSDAMYPDWAKYWAFRSMTEMSKFNKTQNKFPRRNKKSMQGFPTLNIGALARTISFVQEAAQIDRLPKGDLKRNEVEARIENTLKNIHTLPEYFDELDVSEQEVLVEKKNKKEDELRKILTSENFSKIYQHLIEARGDFSKEQLETIAGYWKTYEQGSSADELYDSLQGYPLEWCTAENYSTAQDQLDGGDFHVYYSENSKGQAIIPRLAIRMEGEKIGENPRGVEESQNIDQFIQPILNEKIKEFGVEGEQFMKKSEDMKRMTEITEKHRSGLELDKEDLRFLYEIDGEIEGFGYQADPRVMKIKETRDNKSDLAALFDCRFEQIALTEKEALAGNCVYYGGRLDLRGLSSAEGLILPEHIGGRLDLRGLSSAEGLILPEHIGGYLNLRGLISAEGLTLPEHIGGDLNLSSLISAEGLTLPEHIGGDLNLDGLSSADLEKIKEKYPQHRFYS